MEPTTMTVESAESTPEPEYGPLEQLQSEAWYAFNSALHAVEGDEYRQVGHDLYRQLVQERIRALYARGDKQNAILDAHLKGQRSARPRRARAAA
jgi:hypothetical protein